MGKLELFWSAIGAVLGGGSVEMIRAWRGSREQQFDDAGDFRRELLKEIKLMKDREDELRRALDEWRERYFKLNSEMIELQQRIVTLEGELRALRASRP